MNVVAHWPPIPNDRAERVTAAVKEALVRYGPVFETDTIFRCITLEIKMRSDGTGVRAVLVTFQGDFTIP